MFVQLSNVESGADIPGIREINRQDGRGGATVREQPELSIEELDLPSVMHALADPSRLRMVAVLDGGAELSCAELGEQAGTATSKSTTTHHVAVLRDAGLIRTRHEGQRKLVTLRRVELDAKFPGLLDAVIGGIDASA
jgi:DNA-binding transcriptional ArsR family regulator